MAQVNRPNAPQTYRTPPEFLAAVQARFGRIDFDAACTLEDAVAPMGYHHPAYDALERDWAEELAGLTVWCNPPFKHAGKFAARAAASQRTTGAVPPPRVLLLCQAAVDSNWYWEHVADRALVLALSPRVPFLGEDGKPAWVDSAGNALGINRALMLACYGPWASGFQRWRWR